LVPLFYKSCQKTDSLLKMKVQVVWDTSLILAVTKTVRTVISFFHRASLLLVTFINRLMHSIKTVVDVKICVFKSLNNTH
jgi:hypothetical protein